MHFIPHQRSLPPIPMTSSVQGPSSWQRSSLPSRSRTRSPVASWNRSSLPFHPRQRPSSYYEPDSASNAIVSSAAPTVKEFHHNDLPPRSSSSNFNQYLRSSSSSYDLHDRYAAFHHSPSSRYAIDDLAPLSVRPQLKSSFDRRSASARSSHDIHRYTDSYFAENDDFRMKNFNRRFLEDSSPPLTMRRENFYGGAHSFDSYVPKTRDLFPRTVSPAYTAGGHNNYTPCRSNPSRHSSMDDISPPISIPPPSPRNHIFQTESSYNRKCFGTKRSMKKDYLDDYSPYQPHYQPDGYQTNLKSDPQKDPKYVYIKEPMPQHCTQVLATLVVSLGPLCAGLGKGYSSPALASMAALSAQGQHFSISKEQGSWVASLSLLGAFFGSLPAGMSMNLGRKKVLCVVAIPFAFSWILTVLATNVYMLYAAAILGGVCTAIISVVTPIYISEIAHPDIRGCLCSFSKMNSNVGMLISYLLGAFMNWRQLATVTAIAPACLFFCSLLIPETPSFLLYRGRDAEAMEALKWLRGSTTDVSREMNTMKANIEASQRHQQSGSTCAALPRNLLRPLFITCGLMVFQKFSGANAFNFYAVPILSETFVGLNPYRAAVVVAFVQICAGMASSALVDTVGRRPLLIFSNMLMAASLAAFGCYVYLKGLDQNSDIFTRQGWKESDWVPLFCILVIEIAYALGVSPISWLYIGELFPLKHRGFGAIAASVSYACSFASVKTFVDLQTWLGLYGAFWFYATIAAVALAFTLVFVPETKGKSLQEMQAVEQHKETLI